jgi:hypothetical protein
MSWLVRGLFHANRRFRSLRPTTLEALPFRERPWGRGSHAEITIRFAVSAREGWFRTISYIGAKMSAESVIYYLNRQPDSEPVEDTEWLFSALSEFTGAELRELLYVAQEPQFFELMRGLFAMSDESRAALSEFLAGADARPAKAAIEGDGRCVLSRIAPGENGKTALKVVS